MRAWERFDVRKSIVFKSFKFTLDFAGGRNLGRKMFGDDPGGRAPSFLMPGDDSMGGQCSRLHCSEDLPVLT